MQVLREAAESLEQEKGSVVSLCGTAGTGKSRLVHEFKKTIDFDKFQWFDGNAYPYTQNTPYYPLIDLLTKAFGIDESDGAEAIKQKIESSIKGLLGEETEIVAYIGGLFSIEYTETSEVSPEYWKDQLYSAVEDVLKALTKSRPTIICLEGHALGRSFNNGDGSKAYFKPVKPTDSDLHVPSNHYDIYRF